MVPLLSIFIVIELIFCLIYESYCYISSSIQTMCSYIVSIYNKLLHQNKFIIKSEIDQGQLLRARKRWPLTIIYRYSVMEFLKFYNKWKWLIREFNFLIRRPSTYIGQYDDNKLLIVTLKPMSLRRNNCSFPVTTRGYSVLLKPVIGDDDATKTRRDLFTY